MAVFQTMTFDTCPICSTSSGKEHISSCPFNGRGTPSMVIRELKGNLDFWRDVSTSLADMHAATLEHEGSLKSCPKSRKERYRSIAQKALDYLNFSCVPQPHGIQTRGQWHQWVRDRLMTSLESTQP